MTRRTIVIAVLVWASACVPELPDDHFSCASANECPDGFACIAGFCRRGSANDGGVTGCPDLTPPSHGSLDGTSASAGDTVTYSCETGYVLTGNGGSASRLCRADGTWSGEAPSCEQAVSPCEPNPCLHGGTCTTDGTSFTCECDPESGYTGTTCDTLIECPELVAPDDGNVDRMKGGVGDVATYRCDSGYYPIGEPTRECQADGSWSGTPPTCASTGGYPLWPLPGTMGRPHDYDVQEHTVIDRITRLEWQRGVSPSDSLSWDAARAYCADLELDEKSDWRLPTRIELLSIVDYARSGPAIDTTAFPSTPLDAFWTSSTVAGTPNAAWAIGFGDGNLDPNPHTYGYRVRCVR